MIISASRRTDIPAYFADWFIQRLKDGFIYVRNPINRKQVSKILLSPDIVECIVFWTKNPAEGFINKLKEIDHLGYKYYFQFTITSYDDLIEKNVPKKSELIEKFIRISKKVGKEKIIWRYDPIFINKKYSINYHEKYFEYISQKLNQYTNKCIISFIDVYQKIKKRLFQNDINELHEKQMKNIAEKIAMIAKQYNIVIESCCEIIDLSLFDINHSHCIDPYLINKIIGKKYYYPKDKSQRKACGCVESIDVGAYNTCRNSCLYCYANWIDKINTQNEIRNDNSPIIGSDISNSDIIIERNIKKNKLLQNELFP